MRPTRRFVAGSASAVLFASASVAHRVVVDRGPDYVGPLLVGSHVFTLVVTTLLLLLCACLGLRALRRTGIEMEGPLEALPFAVALGIAGAGTVLLLAGTLGGIRPWGVALVTSGLAVVAWPSRHELVEHLRGLPADLRRMVPHDRLRWWGVTVTGVAAIVLILPALAPPFDWDSLAYHLEVPAQYLAAGRVFLPEDNFHAALIGPVQMLYLPLLAVASDSGPAVLNALLALLVVLAASAMASRLLSSRTGGLCLVAVWTNTVLVAVAVTPRVDTTLVLFTLLGHYALLIAWSRASRRLFLLSAVILGAAVGVKLQALAYVLALLPLFVWLAWVLPWRADQPDLPGARRTERLRTVAAFAGLGVAAALPWLVRNQLFVGSPFYVLGEKSLEPWLAAISGTATIPPSVEPYALSWLGSIREPFNLFAAFFAPWRLSPEGVQYFLSPLLLLLPLAIPTFRRNRMAVWLLAGGLGYAVVLLIPFPETNLRYLAPAVVPLTMLAAYGILSLLDRLMGPARATWAAGAVAVIGMTPTVLVTSVFILPPDVFTHAIGQTSRRSYLDHPLRLYGLREILDEAPTGGRVLMIFEARSFRAGNETLQDVSGTNWPFLLATGAPDECLEGTGITHVLINNILPYNHTNRGFDPVRMGMPAFDRFARECLREVKRDEPLVLYAVVSRRTGMSFDRNGSLEPPKPMSYRSNTRDPLSHTASRRRRSTGLPAPGRASCRS